MAKLDVFQGLQRVSCVMLFKAGTDAHLKKIIAASESLLPSKRILRSFETPKALLCEIKDNEALKNAAPFGDLIRRLKHDKIAFRAIPGYSKTGRAADPLVFPNGIICILLKKPLSVLEKQRLIPARGVKIIKTYGRSEFIKIQVPAGKETEADALAAALSKKAVVEAATPDFDYFGDYDRTAMMPPPSIPDVRADSFLQRSFVERAWQLGWGKAGIDVAVIDRNFLDHADLTYNLEHGFDAEDGDHDPRSPLQPPDVATSSPIDYRHGTQMSGVISGKGAVDPTLTTGVAPLANIVPIRSASTHFDPMTQAQAYLDEWVSNWVEAMVEIFFSRAPVINASFALNINPAVIPDSWYSWLNWLCWYSGNGSGRFMSVSAGNTQGDNRIAFLASRPTTFAVGWADRVRDEPKGNSGAGLDISVPDGYWGALYDNNGVLSCPENTGGSSVSAAVVSGTAALMYAHGNFTSREIADIIRRTARRSPNFEATADENGFSSHFGYGYLDAFAAVKQARKGPVSAGRLLPIKFDDNGTPFALVQQLGRSPWFWCLTPASDDEGDYWTHWRQPSVFGEDISAGVNKPGAGLVVGDFNGDGRDEIAVQQSGNRQNRFDVIRYSAASKNWYKMGPSQDSLGSAFVWGTGASRIDQVFGADVDGDGKMELVSRRDRHHIDLGKFASSRWSRFGAGPTALDTFDKRLTGSTHLEILTADSLAVSYAALRRPDLGKDLVAAISLTRVVLGHRIHNIFGSDLEIPLSTQMHGCCSLHGFNNGLWQTQVLDGWGTTHIPVPFTPHVFVADFDGDGYDEIALFVRDESPRLVMIDFAYPFSTLNTEHGYIVSQSEWPYETMPESLVLGDFDGNGSSELAFLDTSTSEDRVRFVAWDPLLREWKSNGLSVRKPLGNRAVALQAADLNGDGRTEIALLLEKPYGNTYQVFRRAPKLVWLGDL